MKFPFFTNISLREKEHTVNPTMPFNAFSKLCTDVTALARFYHQYFWEICIFQTALLGSLTSSFVHLIALEKGHFCSNVFNGIHLKLSVKLSNSLSV